MDKKTLHQQIEILLETIQEQHNNIKEYSSTIPQIEVDILLSNMRKLYDFLLLLNKLKVHQENKIEEKETPTVEQHKAEEESSKKIIEQVITPIVEIPTMAQQKKEEEVQQPPQEMKNKNRKFRF